MLRRFVPLEAHFVIFRDFCLKCLGLRLQRMFMRVLDHPLVVFFLRLFRADSLRYLGFLLFDEIVHRNTELCEVERVCLLPLFRVFCLTVKNFVRLGLEFLGDFGGNGEILAFLDRIEVFGKVDRGFP